MNGPGVRDIRNKAAEEYRQRRGIWVSEVRNAVMVSDIRDNMAEW